MATQWPDGERGVNGAPRFGEPAQASTVPPMRQYSPAVPVEEALVDEVAAQRRGVGVPLAEDQVDHRLAVATPGLELLGQPVEHDQPLRPRAVGIWMQPAVAHERAQHLRRIRVGVAGLVGVRRPPAPRAAAARRNAADEEASVPSCRARPARRDEPGQGLACRPCSRARSRAATSSSVVGAEHEGRDHGRRSSSASRPTSAPRRGTRRSGASRRGTGSVPELEVDRPDQLLARARSAARWR